MELVAILVLVLTLVGTNLLDRQPASVITDDVESSPRLRA
jgi:hypothetical protein